MSAEDVSLIPHDGWHCLHLFYQFDRAALAAYSAERRAAAATQLIAALDPQGASAPTRLQTGIAVGHKADFAIMALDPDPLKLDALKQRLASGDLGPILKPTYSYISVTEVSEYVPTLEQYGKRLVEEGETVDTPAYKAKLAAYEKREIMMREQRLRPEMPAWPAMVFYPMNKWRVPGANWFSLSYDERYKLMAEHGRSGMAFGGRVTQLITVGVGFDDWEWGVTLWAKNPTYLKDIVYKMRFDEASAKYAEFGPFYTSYQASAEQIVAHCGLRG
ncbi:MAG: heme-dependent peroxidase [Pirellulales bacterium]